MLASNKLLPIISTLCLITLSACTTPKKVSTAYDVSRNSFPPIFDLSNQISEGKVIQKKGAFLSKNSVLLENEKPLPNLFEQFVKFDSEGTVPLSTITQKISKLNQVIIDLTPDIFNNSNLSSDACTQPAASNSVRQQRRLRSKKQKAPLQTAYKCEPQIAIQYEGTLKGLLTELANKGEIYWVYKDDKVVFSRLMQATFAVNAVSAQKNLSYQGNNNNLNAPPQTTERDINFKETITAASKLLSPLGKLIPSTVSYSITVIDTASAIKNIRNFIENDNQAVLSPIGLSLRVYSIALKNKGQPNIDWSLVMREINSDNSTSNSNQNSDSQSTTSDVAKIINDPQKLLAALQKQGHVKTILSTNVNTLNNAMLPFSVNDNRAYISGLTAVQNNNQAGNLYSLEQKTLSTGFSMKVQPILLSHRKVLMQIQLDLSNLEDMQEYRNTNGQINSSNNQKISKKDRAAGILQLPRTSSISTLQQSVMRSGQTLLVNGLHWSRKMPVEQRRLFSRKTRSNDNSNNNDEQEIIILVSPSILSDA